MRSSVIASTIDVMQFKNAVVFYRISLNSGLLFKRKVLFANF